MTKQLVPKFQAPWRGINVTRSSGSWGNRGSGNEILSGIENGLSFIRNIGDHIEDGLNYLVGLIPGGDQTASEFVENQKRKRETEDGGLYVTVKGDTIRKPYLNMTFPPDVTPARIAKLTSLGWKADEAKNIMISPKGEKFMFHNGKLMSVQSAKEDILTFKSIKTAKKADNRKLALENRVAKLKLDTNLDFSLKNWQSLGGGHKMTPDEIRDYTTEALPLFLDTYEDLAKNKKLILKDRRWYGWFDEPVSSDPIMNKTPILQELWAKGYRPLDGETGAMSYIIANSPLGKKLYFDGIPMVGGVPNVIEKELGGTTRSRNLETNQAKTNMNFDTWTSSNRGGASTYATNNGLVVHFAPLKEGLVHRLVPRMNSNPTSRNWGGATIGDHIVKDSGVLYRTQGPLKDELSKSTGVFSVIGAGIPRKAIFGGSGLYRTDGDNLYQAYKSLLAPITLGVTTEELLNKEDKKKGK